MPRKPEHIPTARIAPLSRLPAFFALKDERVVVAGGSAAATWKAELLSAAGARVDVFALEPGEDMLALASAPPNGAVVVQRRNWSAEDLSGAGAPARPPPRRGGVAGGGGSGRVGGGRAPGGGHGGGRNNPPPLFRGPA